MDDRPWIHREEKRAMELKECGLNYKEIGELLGRTADAVRYKCYLIRTNGYRKKKTKTTRKWTRAEEEKLLELKAKGLNYEKISKVLGRGPSAISMRWQKLNNFSERKSIEPGKCPVCGNTRPGEVTTSYSGTIEKGYFCSNCLTEWTKKGILKPVAN